MKNRFIILIGIILVSFYSPIFAATVQVDKNNIRYTVDDVAMTAEVYGPVSSSTKITNLVIPDFIEYNNTQIPVISIRDYAFSKNGNISGSLTIGDNVEIIGDYSFESCRCSGSLIIGNSVKTIGSGAFKSSIFRGNLILGNSIVTIGDEAFLGCPYFTGDLIIPNSVKTIGKTAFRNSFVSPGGSRLILGNSIETIEKAAFIDCNGFNGPLIIPNSIKRIGDHAFSECIRFTSLELGESLLVIEDYAFSHNNFIGELNLKENIQFIGEGAFHSCSGFTGSLTIPDNVQSIGTNAFKNCTGFNGSLSFGKNLEMIGQGAFENCSGLNGVLDISGVVSYIGGSAFNNCTGFTSLILGESIKTIGAAEFSMYYGSSFGGCGNLLEITCLAIEPPLNLKANFDKRSYERPLYVPYQSLNLYKTAADWKDFKYINPIPVEVTEISLNKTELSLLIGQEETLIATLTPEDATTEVVWSIEGTDNIISVNQNGKVKALYVGTANVVATAGEVSATCKVTVNPVVAAGITLNAQDLTLLVGQTDKLTATVTPDNTTDKTIAWKSDNKAVATVGADGTVTAVSVGVAIITATCGEATATCKVTVNPILATSISINGSDIHTLKQTETLQLTATVVPDNTTYQEIIWKSSDDSKATVSNSGLVTAIEEGNVEIIATLSYQPQITTSYNITIQKRLLGDANDNGVVNVADVGTISDYIVEKPVYNFCFVNADVITDGRITTADVTATVDIIFNDTPSMAKFAKARKISTYETNELIVDNFNPSASSIVDVNLKNPSEFTGLQASIIIPEGVTIRNVTKGAGASHHILNYNVTDHGTVEFILYSLQNDSFDETGSLIELEILADGNSGDLKIENILASDSKANEYSLPFSGGKNNDLITSLDRIEKELLQIYSVSDGIVILNAQGVNANIFTIAGERIVSAVVGSNKEFYSLTPGFYIVTVKSETAKLIVK